MHLLRGWTTGIGSILGVELKFRKGRVVTQGAE